MRGVPLGSAEDSAPLQMIDSIRHVDAIVETEHAVWTLTVANLAHAGDVHERLTQVVDAGDFENARFLRNLRVLLKS